MKRWGWIAFVWHGMLAAALAAAPLNRTAVSTSPVQVEQMTKDASGVSLNLQLDEPTWETVEANGRQLFLADYLQAGVYAEPGQPAVPVASRFFRLPATGGASVEVVNAEYQTMSDVDYAAMVGGDMSSPEYGELDEAVDAWFPSQVAEVTPAAIFHDFRVASLVTYPIQVNPARHEVRVYSNVDVRLSYNNNDHTNELAAWPTRLSENFLPYYREFLDWSDSELDEYEVYRGAVQVVVQDTTMTELRPWIEWKRQKGWDLDFLTPSDAPGWSATAIRNELINRYQNSDPKFDFIVIIGDGSGTIMVPPSGFPVVYGSGHGDDDYACIAGTDDLADVAVGRISVESNTQLLAYKNKVMTYEKTPYMADTTWYHRGLVAAGSPSSGLSTILVGRYARHLMLDLGYTQVDTAWYNDGQGDVNSRDITHLNQGVSFFNYRGWLGTGIGPSEISSLNNSFKLPFVVDITCGTGNWYQGTGHNEAWMRAGTPTVPKGGIGGISTATSHTNTRANNNIAGGAIRSVFVYHNPNMGMAILSAKVNHYQNFYPHDNTVLQEFRFWNNLMGDPTVWLWTDVPQEINVSALASFQLGQNAYNVTVQKDGQPLANAWVCLYKVDDNESVVVKGVTNAQGEITLNAPIRFAGTAKLTVTSQNCIPFLQDVVVTGNNERVGFDSYTIVDNGTNGTSGNNNGQADAGETVGIRFTAKNFGASSYSNVSASITSTDPWIDEVSGTASFGTMAAGAEVESTDLILVTVADHAQQGWISNLHVSFESGATTWVDNLMLDLHAAQFAYVSSSVTGELVPGGTATMQVTLRNVGEAVAPSGTATMISRDPYLGVSDADVNFTTTTIGGQVTIGPFTLHAHAASFQGYPADYKIVMNSSTGQTDTVYATVNLGNRRTQDPVGPDRYGYFAFDDTDTDYDIAPTYDWIEINPSASGNDYDGTQLAINDASEEDDDTVLLTLPFSFQFYGASFDSITVTGNGFISMGDQRDMPNPRNWTIPSPLGPNYMIAPYWDDRQMNNGGVYTYYDQPNGRYIIEWYNTRDGGWSGSNYCTFQLVLYDQVEGHITNSGDNEFLFQYGSMQHGGGDGSDIPYWTTGIENGDQTDGLMCAYWNTTMPGMASITQGRAILFTPQIELITGDVEGDVTYALSGDGVPNVTVRTSDYLYSAVTDENGHYVIPDVIIGVHDFVAEGSCINTITTGGQEVFEDQTLPLNFSATKPEFELDVNQIDQSVHQGEEETVPITISNPGDGPVDWSVSVDFWGPTGPAANGQDPRGPVVSDDNELDELWQLLFAFDLDSVEFRNRGVTHDDRYIWVSGSDNLNPAPPNKLYRYSNDGVLLGTYDQPVPNAGSVGFYGLAWDGEYLYGAEDHYLYKMQYVDDSIVAVDSIEIPVNPARYLAYDPDHDWFWMGDYSTPLYAVDRSGTVQANYSFEFIVSSVAYYQEDPEGLKVYLVSRDANDETITVHKMDPATGAVSFGASLAADGLAVKDIDITYHWNPIKWSMLAMFDGLTDVDQMKVWEVGDNSVWLSVNPDLGTIEPGESQTVNVTMRGMDLPPDTYSTWLRFDHHTCDEVTYVPVNLTTLGVEDQQVSTQPLEWAFDGAYPNPFNPTSTIRFSLKQTTSVQARLFNIMGQQVAVIQNGVMTAGHHEMVVDGSNLASGVYFLAFQAGPLHTTKKLVLLK